MRKLLLAVMAILFVTGQLLAQKTVTGKVTDDKGEPLANASVTVKGSNTGTVTKPDGTYSLTVPGTAKILVFSTADMETIEITIGSQSVINASLKSSDKTLEEVVMVGYGVQQKNAFTGAASKVDVKEFSNLIAPSVDKLLAGRATGVQVTNSSGLINQPARIFVRGVNSINQGTGPLFVVDGIPIITGNLAATTNSNAIGDINPSDIESIEVLKDGSATAIYGSRAAAGVILITTKKGTKGRAKVNYDGFVGFSNVLKRWDLLNAEEFVMIANEKLANVSPTGLAPRAFLDAEKTNTDWQDQAFIKNAFVQNHTLSLQGGSDKTSYYFSLNFSNQQGSVFSNQTRAYRVRLNLDHEINRFVKFGNNLTVTRQEDWDQNNGSNSLGGAIASSLRLLPNVSPFSATTSTGYNINYPTANSMAPGANTQSIDDNFFNIAFTLKNNRQYSDKYRLIDNFFVEITPVKGLSLRSQASADMLNDYSFQKWDPRHGDGYSNIGLAYNADQNFLRYVWQNYFNYTLKLHNHSFYLTGGHELQSTTTKWFSAQGVNISDLFFIKENVITGSATTPTIGGNYTKEGFESLFGRFNYDFKNKYFFQASIRRDGQSSLAPDKRYGTFPGASIGWRPSQEGFWGNSPFLNKWIPEAKIKVSYAKVGNTLSGFPYLSTFGTAPYGNISGIAVNAIGNSDLLWETSQKYDAGVELAILKKRISLTADWFLNDVDNLVLNVPTPFSAGIPGNAIAQNIGKLQNRGIELAVNATILSGKDFTWDVSANYSLVKNKITKLYELNGAPVPYIQNGNYNLIQVDDPINIIYGYRYAGVNTANGNPMYYKADGTLVQQNFRTGASIGGFFLANSKTDGTIGAASSMGFADRVKLGQGVPTWFGSISNVFNYKGLELDIMFRYSGGNKIVNTTKQEALMNQSFQNNGKEILKRWTTAGDVTDVPRLYYGQGNNINQNSIAISRFVEKGDYIRLQNVALSYTITPRVMQKLTNGFIQQIKVYVQGQNLHVWTKYSGADPDNITGGGIDQSVSPQIKTWSFGLNVGF
jgi:TonB-dependent starch-binding outer membrane protein SusC